MTPEPIVPDTKDWTWTLKRTCPECGYTACAVSGAKISGEILRLTAPWRNVLERDDVHQRPRPDMWSPLEYAAHVRDVCRVFLGRVELMLREDDPPFNDWDQDVAAVEGRYADQDPAAVCDEIEAGAQELSRAFGNLDGTQWARTGSRSNGSAFTIRTLGQYCLHDLAHHLVDVHA